MSSIVERCKFLLKFCKKPYFSTVPQSRTTGDSATLSQNEEEACRKEHHLQRAMVTGLIIPTPDVDNVGDSTVYDVLYPPNYKVPRQLIHMQPLTMEQDIPDYDMDSEDERWLANHSKSLGIDELKFEKMMDQLEKNSGDSVVTQAEAKILLKEDDDLILTVYDYWLNKRLRSEITDNSDGCGAKFSALVVSNKFEGKPLLQRNRMVDGALAEELKSIHRKH